MHILHDENGTVCAHTHEHTHVHEHTYTHEHSHDHEHGEEHDHKHVTMDCSDGSCNSENCSGCGHTHASEEAAGDKMTALLDYMLKHNEHHAAELDQVAAKLLEQGKTNAAEQIKKAVDEFQKGNLYLNLALSSLKDA